MKKLALFVALVLTGCQVQTAFGPVSVERGPSFDRHIDHLPTQSVDR